MRVLACLVLVIGAAGPARTECPVAPLASLSARDSELAARAVAASHRARNQCQWELTGHEADDLRHFDTLLAAVLDYLELAGTRACWPEPLRHAPLSRTIEAEQANLVLSFSDVRSLKARYQSACRRRSPSEAASQYCVAIADVLGRLQAALDRVAVADAGASASHASTP